MHRLRRVQGKVHMKSLLRKPRLLSRYLSKYHALPIQLKTSFWFLVCAVLQKGIQAITTPIFTRIMNPADYGLFGVFTSWQGIVAVVISLNLYCGVYIQGLVKFDDIRERYTSSIEGLTLTLILLWLAVYLATRAFWNRIFSLTTVQMIAMFATIWGSSVFSFWATEQRVDFKYSKLVALTLAVSLIQPIVGIVAVLHASDKVTAKILSVTIVDLLAYTWLFVYHMRRGKVFFSRRIWKYALCFNIPLVPHYLSTIILASSDRIMIEKMTGATNAGIYNLAYYVALIMTLLSTALTQTIEPWLYKKIKAKDFTSFPKVAYPSFTIIAGANILLMLFAPEVVRLFAPPAYHDAIWIIPPVAMSAYFMFTYSFFAVFEFYYEKTSLIAFATLVGAVLNIILNYIFIGKFGYYAAGYTTLVCYVIYSAMHYIFMRHICNRYLQGVKPYSLRVILAITFVFVALGFAILSLYRLPSARLALATLLLAITFCLRRKIFSAVSKVISVKNNNIKESNPCQNTILMKETYKF